VNRCFEPAFTRVLVDMLAFPLGADCCLVHAGQQPTFSFSVSQVTVLWEQCVCALCPCQHLVLSGFLI
jgi:hypothetical protein